MSTFTTNDGTSQAGRDGPYSDLPNKRVRAANGVDYAYRDTGPGASGGAPLVLFQHFRGNLDSWDPATRRTDSCSSTTPNSPLMSRPSSATLVNR